MSVLVSEVVCGAGVLLLVAVVGIGVLRVRGVAMDVRAALLLGFGALLGVLRVRLARDWGLGLDDVARPGGVGGVATALVLCTTVVWGSSSSAWAGSGVGALYGLWARCFLWLSLMTVARMSAMRCAPPHRVACILDILVGLSVAVRSDGACVKTYSNVVASRLPSHKRWPRGSVLICSMRKSMYALWCTSGVFSRGEYALSLARLVSV